MKFPDWTEEEIILLLDFHFRFRLKSLNQGHPAVKKLCETIKLINRENKIDKEFLNDEKFRSESSIIIKRRAFQEIDSKSTRITKNSNLDFDLWLKYNENLEELKKSATQIRSKYNISSFDKNIYSLFPEVKENYSYIDINFKKAKKSIEGVPEGKSKLKIHYSKERNVNIVKEKKKWALDKYGKLQCEVCDFDFQEKYGSIGKNFIECHHLKPISQLEKQEITKIDDLALVCSNCHRMLHNSKNELRINQLKEVISKK